MYKLQKNRALFQPRGHCGKILSKEANANGSCRDKQLVLKNTFMLIFWISLTVLSCHCAFSLLCVNGLRFNKVSSLLGGISLGLFTLSTAALKRDLR